MFTIKHRLARRIMQPAKGPSRRTRHFASMDRLLARRAARDQD